MRSAGSHGITPSLIIETAGRAFKIGRTKARQLARTGAFPVKILRLGAQYRVPTAAIVRALGLDDQEPS